MIDLRHSVDYKGQLNIERRENRELQAKEYTENFANINMYQ